MLNWIREVTKSAETKRHERMTAYIDGEMSPQELQQFKTEMAQNATLRSEIEAQRRVRTALRALPPRPVPRNFTLDPAAYRSVKPQPTRAERVYPGLRLATSFAVFVFMFMSVLTVWPTLAPAADEAAMASDTAAETVAQVEEELVVPEAAMLEAPEAGGVGGGIEEEAEMMAADEASDSADMESFAAETDAATSRAAPAAEAAPGIASAELQTAPDEDAAASAADAVMADEALPAPESTPAAEALAAPVDESGDEALAREVADSAESPPPAERTTVTAAPIGEPEPAPLTVALIVTGIVSLLLIGLLLFVRSRVDDKL